jgi:hypothetical protein
MPALRDIQAAFIHDAYSGEKTSAVYLNKYKLNSPERLGIYYNNTLLGLTDILIATYPILQKIVGESFFRTIARFYIETNSQNTGNRHAYGVGLASFLRSYEPAASWPYLPDIAAIEWAYFQASIANDAPALDFSELTDLISEHPGFIVLLHPGVHYIELNFNALEIWQEHQRDEIETIKLQESPQTVLIWRDQKDEIFIQKISEPLKKLLQCCREGIGFGKAMFQSSDGLQDLTLFQQEFARVVSSGVFVYVDGNQ